MERNNTYTRYKNNNNFWSFFSFVFTFWLYRFHMVTPFYTDTLQQLLFLELFISFFVLVHPNNFSVLVKSIIFTMRSHLWTKSTISPYAKELNGQICLNVRHRHINSLLFLVQILIFLVCDVCVRVCFYLFVPFHYIEMCLHIAWTTNKMIVMSFINEFGSLFCFVSFLLQ